MNNHYPTMPPPTGEPITLDTITFMPCVFADFDQAGQLIGVRFDWWDSLTENEVDPERANELSQQFDNWVRTKFARVGSLSNYYEVPRWVLR